jgi:hypothetical protein
MTQEYIIWFWDSDAQVYRERFRETKTVDEARAWVALQRITGSKTTYIIKKVGERLD